MADLPVIDNIDIYSQFNDVAFLRRLHEELGDELEQLSGDAVDLDARREHFAEVVSPARAQGWLDDLNDEERTTLRAKFNRFRELPPAEQDRMRALHHEIVSSSDARQLERTMLAYQQWLGGLSPVRQFELRNTSDFDARIAQIKRWADEMHDDELLTLSNDELEALFKALRGPINQLRATVCATPLARRRIAPS